MNSQLAPLSPGNLTERHYEMLVQAVVDYAIFMLDPEGYVVSWNAGAARTNCLLYTSPSPRDRQKSRMPSSA